jgi:transposase
MEKKSRFSPEVRERAVRLVTETREGHDSEWAAITSVAEKIGCTPETLRKWLRQRTAHRSVDLLRARPASPREPDRRP